MSLLFFYYSHTYNNTLTILTLWMSLINLTHTYKILSHSYYQYYLYSYIILDFRTKTQIENNFSPIELLKLERTAVGARPALGSRV